jgi:hypothetical protein
MALFGDIQETIEAGLGRVDEVRPRKILWENVVRLYSVTEPPSTWPNKGEAS